MNVDVLPLTEARWPDLEALFGAKGCSMARGCWCLYYRETAATAADGAAGRKAALHGLAGRTPAVGLLAYGDGEQGAVALEAYPIDKDPPGAATWLWPGPMSMYRKAGFVEVARRRPERPVVRLPLQHGAAPAG